MTWGKFLTQATFAAILAMMAILPVTTYGCLMLKEAEKRDTPTAPASQETPAPPR